MLFRSKLRASVRSCDSLNVYPLTRVAAAVAALVVAYAEQAGAAVFTTGITGSETGYESVRTAAEDGTIVYNFADGDRIELSNPSVDSSVDASNGTRLELNGSLGIRHVRRAPRVFDSSYGLFAEGIGSSIVTDDLTLDMRHEAYVGAPISFIAYATGIYTDGGSVAAGNIDGTICVAADRSAGDGFATVNALSVVNDGRLVVDGDADFVLSASASAGQASITGLSLNRSSYDARNYASIGGLLRVTGSAVIGEGDYSSFSDADAAGILVNSSGEMLVGRLETDLKAVTEARVGQAEATGIGVSALSDEGMLVQVGSADIRVSARSSGGGESAAFGITSNSGAVVRIGDSAISVTAVSESSAKAYGLYTNAGTIDLTSGFVTITVLGESTGSARVDGVLVDSGTVRIGSGNISAVALAGENGTSRALVAQYGTTIDYAGGHLSATSDGWQAVGLYADGGTIRTGSFTAEIGNMQAGENRTNTPRTVGMWLSDHDSSVTVEGDADFTMTSSGSRDLLMSTGVALGGEVIDEFHKLTVTGELSVKSAVTPLDDAVPDAWIFSRGLYVDSGVAVDIGSMRLDLSAAARAPEQYAETTGIDCWSENGLSKIRIGDVDIRLSSIGENGAETGSYGIYATALADVELGAGDIRTFASSDGIAYAVAIESEGGRVTKGAGTLAAVSDGEAYGIYAAKGGSVTYAGGTVSVESYGTAAPGSSGTLRAAGILGLEGSTVTLTGSTSIDVRGPNAAAAMLEGSTLTVAGDLTAASSGVGLSMDPTSTLVVAETGSVTFDSVSSSGTTRLAAGSSLTVTGESDVAANTLGSIEATNARINVGAGSYAVTSLSGTGNTLRFTNLADNTGVVFDALVTDLSLAAAGTANDQFASPDDAARAVLEAVTFTDPATTLGATDLVVEEGAVNDGLTARVGEDGTLSNVRVTENTKLSALGSLTLLGAFQWRHDMAGLSRRAGELRDAPQGVGTWVRAYGTNLSYGGVDNTNSSIQVGADTDAGGGWKLGAAFSYTDGSSDLAGGSAESDAYGLALYGTYLKENGAFVDLIAKVSRLESDFTIREMTGSIDNNAWSVSVEAGHRFAFADRAFVEPQIALTYGRVSGDDFVTGNGVRVQQDDFTSLVGRAGARAGFFLPEKKGTLYARFSVLNDFEGELDTRASAGNARKTVHDDIGGTWVEYGVGANFNFTPSTYGYVDFERTSGGEVDEDLRWNAGVRFVF